MSLSPTDHQRSRQRLRDFHLRETRVADLLVDLQKRLNDLARYRADLACGDLSDGDGAQVQGGIEYELWHIEAITGELERRERAVEYGYRAEFTAVDDTLRERFDLAKQVDLIELIRIETGQVGTRAGKTWTFFCPFHGGGVERTPSLIAFPDSHFHCFGCGAHGTDAVAFLAELRCISQSEALLLLESGVLHLGGAA